MSDCRCDRCNGTGYIAAITDGDGCIIPDIPNLNTAHYTPVDIDRYRFVCPDCRGGQTIAEAVAAKLLNRPYYSYGIRKCRGHWHVICGDADIGNSIMDEQEAWQEAVRLSQETVIIK